VHDQNIDHLRHITGTLVGRDTANENFKKFNIRKRPEPELEKHRSVYANSSWTSSDNYFDTFLSEKLIKMVKEENNEWPRHDKFKQGYKKLAKAKAVDVVDLWVLKITAQLQGELRHRQT
jgi:hypothetical protein